MSDGKDVCRGSSQGGSGKGSSGKWFVVFYSEAGFAHRCCAERDVGRHISAARFNQTHGSLSKGSSDGSSRQQDAPPTMRRTAYKCSLEGVGSFWLDSALAHTRRVREGHRPRLGRRRILAHTTRIVHHGLREGFYTGSSGRFKGLVVLSSVCHFFGVAPRVAWVPLSCVLRAEGPMPNAAN